MTQVLLDPTGELEAAERQPLPLPQSLAGQTIGLLDISKTKGDVFLDHIDEKLAAQGFRVERFKKPTFAKSAPIALLQEMAERCDVVLEALAD